MPNPTVPAAATGLPQIPPFIFLLGDLAGLAATNLPDDRLPPAREALERHIEACIALLDAIDGDVDLEDGRDAEWDPAEAGLADHDGMLEQGYSAGRGLELLPSEWSEAQAIGRQARALAARSTGDHNDEMPFRLIGPGGKPYLMEAL